MPYFNGIILYMDLLVLLLTTLFVWPMNVTIVDQGENATMLWRIQPTPLREIRDITVTHEDTGDRKIRCIDLHSILHGRDCHQYDRRVNLVTEPDLFEDIDPFEFIHAIGFSMTNVTLVDAGSYRIRLCCVPAIDDDKHILYVFNNPEKPVVKGITEPIIGETINITCSANSRSLPEDFRNQSVMVYTWNINNPGNNHFVVDNNVIVVNVTHDNEGATFFCMAHEMNSSLTSKPSDLLVLDVYYIEDMNIRLEIIDKQTMTAACFVSCHPPCVCQWYNSSDKISEVEKVIIIYGENYTCTAQNKAGKLSTTIPYVLNLTEQTTSAISGTIIALVVFVIVLLAATVTLAVLYIRRHQLDRSLGGSTSPTTNPQVYVNTSFMENVGVGIDGNSNLGPERETPQHSVNDSNHSNLAPKREPSQPGVYEENYSSLSPEREPPGPTVYEGISTNDNSKRERHNKQQIYENVAQDK